MELAAPAERKKTAPLLAGGLSLVLHAALAAGLLYVLPLGEAPGNAGPMSLSLVSLAVPSPGADAGTGSVS